MRERATIEKRMLSLDEAAAYCGIGKNKMRALAEEVGAIRRFGRRTLVDKTALDAALDKMAVTIA